MSLAAKFAEVFVHRLQNAQVFHQSGKDLFFFICVFLHFFSVLFLATPNLSRTTAALIAQLFQRPPSKLFQLRSWCEPRISCIFLMSHIILEEKN